MGRRFDDRRWVQNDDGSYSRRLDEPSEVTALEYNGGEVETEVEEVNATAGAVELAQELGLDLASVKGTGNKGKVTKADVQAVS